MEVKGEEMKYFIKMWDGPELEVNKEQFIKTEELCGFFPKTEGETSTAGFGFDKQGLTIKGRIEYDD
jgi:hypothetical protein